MLDIERRSGVTVLRLQHGRVNALDLELLRAITAALGEVDERAAVVITGTGTAFCAGADLRRVVAGGAPYVQEFLPALTAAFLAVFDHPGPVLVLAAELLGPAQAQATGLIHGIEEPGDLLESVLGQARRMAETAAGVFAVSKRQLQQPARDRIAARQDEDADVLATWSSAATLEAISDYLGALKGRSR